MDDFHNALEKRTRALSTKVRLDFERLSIEEIQQAVQNLSTLETLKGYLPKPKKPLWVTPVIFALFALFVTGFASMVRIENTEMRIDASIKSFTLDVASEGPELTNSKPINVSMFEAVGEGLGADLKNITTISIIKVLPNTRVTFLMASNTCVLAEVQMDKRQQATPGGIKMVLLAPGRSDTQPNVVSLNFKQGDSVRFCMHDYEDYLLLGRVSGLELSRRHQGDIVGAGELKTSSIVTGEIFIPSTGKTIKVDGSDRLSMREIKDGWVVLFAGKTMRLVFSGKPAVAESVGLSPNELSVDLTPTLLEWVADSPKVRWLFTIITGFVGALWSLARYLGWSLR